MWWSQVSSVPLTPLPAGGVCPPGSDWELLALVFAAGPVVKGVMLVLLAFSVVSWAIIIGKFRQLRRSQQQDADFFERFWAAPDVATAFQATRELPASPAAVIFRQGYAASFPEAPEGKNQMGENAARGPVAGGDAALRAVRRALHEESRRLSASLTFLATCGNTSPFIGLFGTVWGIMTSFHSIGLKGAASIATVAPGIAEALIATAAGLAAAIPAVVAYNYFLGQVRRLEADLSAFAGDLAPRLQSAVSSQQSAVSS